MTQTWLVPLDGSDTALRPLAWIAATLPDLKEAPRVHLLNVQPSLPGDISRFVGADTIRDYHREAGMAALETGHARLAAAGIDAERHVLVGEAGPTIVEAAVRLGCNQILMGTRGHSGLTGTLLGSVAMRVAHLSAVPLLLVR